MQESDRNRPGEIVVLKPEWRAPTLVAWCLAMVGTILFIVSPIAPEYLIRRMLIGGGVLLASGAVTYVAAHLRS